MPKKNKAIEEISARVKNALMQSVDKITPWFFRALPPFFYQMITKEEQIELLHTIISLHQTQTPTTTLHNASGTKTTFISLKNRPGQLLSFAAQMRNEHIRRATSHTTLTGDLAISTFSSHYEKIDFKNSRTKKHIASIKKHLGTTLAKKEQVKNFLESMDQEYILQYDAARAAWHIQTYLQIKDYETTVNLDNERDKTFSRISILTVNPPGKGYLYQIIEIFDMHGIKINRMYVNTNDSEKGGEIVFVTLYGVDKNDKKLQLDTMLWMRLELAVKTVKWVIRDELTSLVHAEGETTFSVRKANFIRAAGVFVHQFLSKIQLERYTYEVIKKAYLSYPDITGLLVDYFYARFSPGIKDTCRHCGTVLENRIEQTRIIRDKLSPEIEQIENLVPKEVFYATIRFIDHILKTNYFVQDNIGLAFRMHPEVLDEAYYPHTPYGFFYFFGRNYKGFQIRFQDMSRGGMRIVRPRDKEHYDFESTRVFDEVYGLSYAQQLKNKDIPEGGSKAILLITPEANLRKCAECTIDSLLDLIVTDGNGHIHPQIVDYYDKEEIIYLGPDENVTNELIEWIIKRANSRKYKYPNAIMSSKTTIGINHKEFGVTSEGVNVYVESCLRYLGIDPEKEEFTVRIVGGPDGDVAGNEIKILIHSYRKVKILAISDGFGAAYDKQGLNKNELMRLFKEGKSIVEFDSTLLNSGDTSFVVDARTIEGRKIRDELQYSNKVKTDLLIPAGGRPNTINIENWQKSLDEQGVPVFRAIVEGANLFLSMEARQKLEQQGAIIIKDSSANKGGVICSSYEIIASLILSEKEFKAIKKKYVEQVITILKNKARMESELLFREYTLHKTPLTRLSGQISQEINELTDTIKSFMRDEIDKDAERYLKLLKAHCPPILVEKYGHRITDDIPEEHRLAILSSRIASYIIYHEGLGWINSLNSSDIVKVIRTYLEQDIRVAQYIDYIMNSDLPGKEEIARVLDRNARKEFTQDALRDSDK